MHTCIHILHLALITCNIIYLYIDKAHSGKVTSVTFSSANKTIFASSGVDQAINLYDLQNQSKTHEITDGTSKIITTPIASCSFTDSGSSLLLSSSSGIHAYAHIIHT